MPELLVELLSEEIPARMQARAADDLKRLVTDRLDAAGLSYSRAAAYVTPRRLALHLEDLPERQPDVTEEKKGPKVGAPEQAVQGFLKANGLQSLDQAETRDTGKGTFYFAVRNIPGRPTAQVLSELLHDAIHALVWPKSMRWGHHRMRWVRPLQAILAVFDGAVLDGRLETGPASALLFSDRTVGHRFLSPEPFTVSGFDDYREKLRAASVLLDPAERRAAIAEQAAALAATEGLTVKDDPALLDEVAGLVEWPVIMMGRIDAQFMDLPPEVLSTSMRAHQKYFSTLGADGNLADRFLLAANMSGDAGREATIVAGNERVLRARLADARFFWDQDRDRQLASRVPALEQIVFHARLGNLAEKVSRMESLAALLSGYVPGADRDHARAAARLAKADLTTGMVGEFPELQGVMGRYYARHDGENPMVADAIAEHYAPLGPGDSCPSAPISVCAALAEKIDTLVGFFAIGETPTGSKDPYALRRAALGVIRLVVENGLRVPLVTVLREALMLFKPVLADGHSHEAVVDSLIAFFADRLKVVLRDKGVRHDLIAAVFALGGEDDLVRLLARVDALKDFLDSEDGANLLIAYRRAANIVRIEAKKDKKSYDGDISVDLLVEPEERMLSSELSNAMSGAKESLHGENFNGAMSAMAELRVPVDAFFDKVTVNAEDAALRENRLRLLSRIGATLGQVADFSQIEG